VEWVCGVWYVCGMWYEVSGIWVDGQVKWTVRGCTVRGCLCMCVHMGRCDWTQFGVGCVDPLTPFICTALHCSSKIVVFFILSLLF
jgi:hypothetical protein